MDLGGGSFKGSNNQNSNKLIIKGKHEDEHAW